MATSIGFSRGGDAAEAGMKSGSFNREVFFSLDDGEGCYIRFVTDEPEWISVDQYAFLPTKPAPAAWTGAWPKNISAVSRADVNVNGEKTFAPLGYADDFIAEHMRDKEGKPYKPSKRVWAYVCMREEVRENGVLVGFRDKTREVSYEKDNATVTEVVKDIRICNLGWKNFFAPINGFAKKFGTVLNRDIWVKRKGMGQNDTTYEVVPMDPTPGWDLRDPSIAAQYPVDKPIEDLVVYRTSDDYYNRFFDTRVTYVPEQRAGATTAAAPQSAPVAQQARPNTEVDEARVASLTSRVMGYATAETVAVAPPAEVAPNGLKNYNS